LLEKGIIRKQNAELERGVPRLVINYKPLNTVLEWIRYLIPNKRDLINRLEKSIIFSKFDMKSGFWQIQIREYDRYKTAFVTPFGHHEWNVMPFGLKNAPIRKSVAFSKFDMKSGFWQIQIDELDRYKTAFVTPFGHYEWNVNPFGLKNVSSEFQNIMNEIFNPVSHFSIVYIDDVLIFSSR
ncbi:hypothetical protein Prudu_122S000600, partial [Prunus dulcis]